MSTIPVIAYSVGEPAGIGPDLAVQLAQRPRDANIMALADPDLLISRAAQLKLPLQLTETASRQPGELWVQPVKLKHSVVPGELDSANAQYVLSGITQAAQYCLQGRAAAMLTGPVHKGIINEAGIPFTGHTEWLADLSRSAKVVMMLVSGELRVALATTHIPIARLAAAITAELIKATVSLVYQELQQKFAMAKPRLAICGLNPHAGENGHIGREEIEVMLPVLTRLRKQGIDIVGPVPADTVFSQGQREQYDAIIALYHDQGLAPFKALSFGEAVNVTLGLPIIRTSVDHGTALALAGTGKAEVGSLIAALKLAVELASKRKPDHV